MAQAVPRPPQTVRIMLTGDVMLGAPQPAGWRRSAQRGFPP